MTARERRFEFDIAVSVSKSGAATGKGGVRVLAAEIGARGEKRHSEEQVSRIRFKVDVNYYLG